MAEISKSSFLDSTIILNYADFENEESSWLSKKCFIFVNKNKNFIYSSYVKKEIELSIKIKEKIYREALLKLKNPSYNPEIMRVEKGLRKDEIDYANRIYENLKTYSPENASVILQEDLSNLSLKVNLFLKSKIFLISTELDTFLVNTLREFIIDYADCKVLASAIQIQQNREQFWFVTADKHMAKGEYNFVEGDIRLEKYKKPILKNLLFED